MALIAWGLLVGLVGLLWVMIIVIVQADARRTGGSKREACKPVYRP